MRYGKLSFRVVWFSILILLLLLFSGCTSTVDSQLDDISSVLLSGDTISARNLLKSEYGDEWLTQQGDLIFNLDMGMLSHYAGLYEDSNKELSYAERRIGEEYTESLAATGATFFANDNSKAYQGERYEDLYLNVFKSLNYQRLGDGREAMVEIRRAIDKIEALKRGYEIVSGRIFDEGKKLDVNALNRIDIDTEFISSALVLYLGMVYSRGIEDYSSYSYCENMMDSTYSSQKDIYAFDMPGFLSSESYAYPEGKARLSFIAFSGMAPYKTEAIDAVDLDGGGTVKVAYPELSWHESQVSSVSVSVNGEEAFSLELLEDMDRVIEDIFSAKQAEVKEKAFIRSRNKIIAASVVTGITGDVAASFTLNGKKTTFSLGGILSAIIDNSESADVRGSHFIPSKAWAGGITLDEGVYDICFTYLDGNGNVVRSEEINDYAISADTVNLVESVYLK